MGYDLHIERVPAAGWDAWEDDGDWEEGGFDALEQRRAAEGLLITLDEWRQAVSSTEGVRLAQNDAVAVNPRTGEEIRIHHGPDDVEVLDDDGQWRLCILFRGGSATFPSEAWSPDHPVAVAACRLASLLSASITGDEGEEYPLAPGEFE